ncbi:MAG TPA: imidazole glycerol phosphate synthase subunit HisH [Candidatus Latescibacteria bacterium]|nr:imidazole glycerol phosphate synthase subunit HisH [Candidatus Latescibacterota bacterium]
MIAILDYEGGNLASVLRALDHTGFDACITRDFETIRRADHVILPGVGAARATMHHLRARGLDKLIREEVIGGGIPFLGICIGVQVIFASSEEEEAECLGILPGSVRRFPSVFAGEQLKVPQIGWNQVRFCKPHPIFSGVEDGASFYFVNSYYPVPASEELIYAKTTYGVEFASVVGKGNLVATQFHLEKSGVPGLRMLENFCRWDGSLC